MSGVVAGRYELGELIGRGGMGEVWLARDRRLRRTVAIKTLRPELRCDPGLIARFQREAEAVAALNHPAIVAVYDAGEETTTGPAGPTSLLYIVMEHVRGRPLSRMLHEGPVTVDQALAITTAVLTALEHAHAAGIVHRDIKPDNVMVTDTGTVKVMDFGIARVQGQTTTDGRVGTPHYLSPEHASGGPVDARTDLYSTGCLLFALLTGRPPFVAESVFAAALQHVQDTPPSPSTLNPEVSPALDGIVLKALAKEPDSRYQTAAEFREALAGLEAVPEVASGLGAGQEVPGPDQATVPEAQPETTPTGQTAPVAPERRARRRVVLVSVAGAVCTAVVAGAALTQPWDRSERPRASDGPRSGVVAETSTDQTPTPGPTTTTAPPTTAPDEPTGEPSSTPAPVAPPPVVDPAPPDVEVVPPQASGPSVTLVRSDPVGECPGCTYADLVIKSFPERGYCKGNIGEYGFAKSVEAGDGIYTLTRGYPPDSYWTVACEASADGTRIIDRSSGRF